MKYLKEYHIYLKEKVKIKDEKVLYLKVKQIFEEDFIFIILPFINIIMIFYFLKEAYVLKNEGSENKIVNYIIEKFILKK